MNSPPHLRPEDRADFEQVLHLALNVADIRAARTDGRAETDADHLRDQVLAAQGPIAAAASGEYRKLLKARAGASRPSTLRLHRPSTTRGVGVWLPAVAVLAPLISAVAALILLLLGYGMRLAEGDVELAGALVAAGWVGAVLAAGTASIALAALLGTAIRRRAADAPSHRLRTRGSEVQRAREAWRQALLERGILPYLREHLADTPDRPSAGRPPAAPSRT